MSDSSIKLQPLALPWDTIQAYPLMKAHVKKRWLVYTIGVIALIVTDTVQALIPKFIQWIIDLLSSAPNAQTVEKFNHLFIIFILCLAAQTVGRRYWRLTLGQETHRMASNLKDAIWERARFFPRSRLDRDLNTGVLMNIATSDVSNARLIFGWTIIGLVDSVFLIVLCAIAMIQINLSFALCVFFTLIFLPTVTKKIAGLQATLHETAQQSLGNLNDLVSQSVSTIRLQRLSQSGALWIRRLTELAEDYRTKRLAVVLSYTRFILIGGLPSLICHVVLFYFGISRVFRGELTIGQFVALQSYILLIQGPLTEIGFLIAEWQRGITSLERLSNIYRQPLIEGSDHSGVQIEDTPALSSDFKDQPVLRIRNLKYKFPNNERLFFSGLTFDLGVGERLGIIGPVGAGKSTLIHILAGFDRNFEGEVLFLGRDIRSYRNSELRSYISYVEQRPFLFADTIRNNIMMDRESTDDEVWSYIEVAGLADDVRSFAGKLDTPLGEWGINLSGGQKQRLTIARALACKPKLLLLDDCLSAVDTLTETEILSALDQILKGCTIVWVAHRRSTLRYCTKFLELGL